MKKSKRKIYIGSFTGNSINVHNPQQEQDEKIQDLKNAERLFTGVQEACVSNAMSFVSHINEITRQVVRLADIKATNNPGLFDGCQEVVRPNADLVPSRSSRGVGGDLFNYLGRTFDNLVDFGKDTFTGHPYDAICDLSDIVMDTTAMGIEAACVPAEAAMALGGLAYGTYKKLDNPGPYEMCPCKQNVLNYINLIVTAAGDPVKALNSSAVTLVKGFADEISYNFDPLKVGAVTGTMAGSVIFGIEKGIVNSAINMMDTGSKAYSMLANNCAYNDNADIVSPKTMEIAREIAQCSEMLYDADQIAKELGRAFADALTGAVATEVQANIRGRIESTSNKWKKFGLYTASSLLPDSLDETTTAIYSYNLQQALMQTQYVIQTVSEHIRLQAQLLKQSMEGWKCQREGQVFNYIITH